jgi:hypothetical protein
MKEPKEDKKNKFDHMLDWNKETWNQFLNFNSNFNDWLNLEKMKIESILLNIK